MNKCTSQQFNIESESQQKFNERDLFNLRNSDFLYTFEQFFSEQQILIRYQRSLGIQPQAQYIEKNDFVITCSICKQKYAAKHQEKAFPLHPIHFQQSNKIYKRFRTYCIQCCVKLERESKIQIFQRRCIICNTKYSKWMQYFQISYQSGQICDYTNECKQCQKEQSEDINGAGKQLQLQLRIQQNGIFKNQISNQILSKKFKKGTKIEKYVFKLNKLMLKQQQKTQMKLPIHDQFPVKGKRCQKCLKYFTFLQMISIFKIQIRHQKNKNNSQPNRAPQYYYREYCYECEGVKLRSIYNRYAKKKKKLINPKQKIQPKQNNKQTCKICNVTYDDPQQNFYQRINKRTKKMTLMQDCKKCCENIPLDKRASVVDANLQTRICRIECTECKLYFIHTQYNTSEHKFQRKQEDGTTSLVFLCRFCRTEPQKRTLEQIKKQYVKIRRQNKYNIFSIQQIASEQSTRKPELNPRELIAIPKEKSEFDKQTEYASGKTCFKCKIHYDIVDGNFIRRRAHYSQYYSLDATCKACRLKNSRISNLRNKILKKPPLVLPLL